MLRDVRLLIVHTAILLAVTILGWSATGCGSTELPSTVPPGENAGIGGLDLPAPSVLKATSYVDSDILRTGDQYRDTWPHARVYPGNPESAVFMPRFDPTAEQDDLAYAIYSFYTDGIPLDQVLKLRWFETADYADCWVGMADFIADTWRWYPVDETGLISFNAACLDEDIAYAVVVLAGTAPWELSHIYLGETPAPQIQGVYGTTGVTGETIDIHPVMNLPYEDVSTWNWQFSGGANPGVWIEAEPHVELQAPNVYSCSVRATNAFGESEFYFLLTVNPSSSGWHIEAVDAVSSLDRPTSIAIGPSDDEYPRIAYVDAGPGSVYYAYDDGTGWHNEELYETTSYDFTSSALATDSAGESHLAFGYSRYLMYGRTWLGAWDISMAKEYEAAGIASRVYTPCLALDSQDTPHASYQVTSIGDDFHQEMIEHSYFDGLIWSSAMSEVAISGGLMEPPTLNEFCPLGIAPYDLPGVLYHDTASDELRYSRFNDSWEDELVVNEPDIDCATMMISPGDGRPRICYVSGSSPGPGAIYYVRPSGASWDNDVIAGAGNVGPHLSIARDSMYRPHICYYEQAEHELTYAYFTGLSWIIQTVDSNGDVGQYCDIAIDNADNPHFSYYDAGGYVKYARLAME